ncbi:MAG: histidine kinase [Bacillota bacterium]|nr:histidine kinase [Bacillota bacterium]
MNKLIDKLIIFLFCLTLYVPVENSIYMIAPILTAIIFSGTLSCLDDQRIISGIFSVYIIVCFMEPLALFFIPLICYDVLIFKFRWIWALALMPYLSNFNQMLIVPRSLIPVITLTAYILKYRSISYEKVKKEYIKLRDNTKEISIHLEKKNKSLLEKQDYEINLAMLKERNRIARDIHDNVGHMLSRSILQIGALLAVNKDTETKESLESIKDTLSNAMDSIRKSVHDLHDESINLEIEIHTLINNFNFCPVEFYYDVESNLDKNLKYCFIAIVKEALSNIAKHSNAEKASVKICEHPALYQLVIEDNGNEINCKNNNGIGLKNISDRISAFNGNVNISTDKGFRIFISVPK